MQIKFILVILYSVISFAQDKDFNIPLGVPADIIKETSELKLSEELSVQKEKQKSNFYINLFGGFAKLSPMRFESRNNVLNYTFNQNIPLLTYQFNHYLINKYGRWGWIGSVGYSYSLHEHPQTSTVLHIVPLDLGLTYRAEFNSTQAIMPYLNLTYSNWIYFQRGVDEYNTSVSYNYGAAAVGLVFNINRLGVISSRNEAELNLQYKRMTNNNSVVQIGGALAL